MRGTLPVSGLESARGVAAGDWSSEELVRASLERIEAREPEVRAWAHLDPEIALGQARERDASEPRSVLHGVPFAIKDIFDTADYPTECGTPIHAGRRPARDSLVVARLREAGAVVLGKTVTTELATRQPGATRNPHDPARTPGGSSSGSAAAVGDGMVPLGLGSQTVGSAIRPGAYCGAWTLKPTLGWVDLRGVVALSPWMDTVGIFGADVADLGAVAAVLAGVPHRPLRPLEAPPRIGLLRTPWWEDRMEDGGRAAIEEAVSRAAGAGAAVEDADLPLSLEDVLAAHGTVVDFGRPRGLAWEYREHADLLSDHLRGAIERGMDVSIDELRRAIRFAEESKLRIAEAFSDWDVLLTPTAPGEAPVGIDDTGDPTFCRPWSLLGLPAVSVPGLRGPNGMPIGIQLVGPRRGEWALLNVAAWLGELLA